MFLRPFICLAACTFLSLTFPGCAAITVPQGGRGTVTIVEGGLVESMAFEGGATLNIQLTLEDIPEYEYLVQHVLTIGKFSPVIGSGFTKRSNIYYESAIGPYGQDTFMAEGITYQVFWSEIDAIPGPGHFVSVFSVTVEQVHF